MDLSTTYMGLKLPHPFLPGASPLADTLDSVKRLEDAGAAAIVMRSLFEEQIEGEALGAQKFIEEHEDAFAEATTLFPRPDDFAMGPDEYLDHLRKIKEAVDIPIIASLNGNSEGGWLGYSKLIEEAGADALELNVYNVETDVGEKSDNIEQHFVNMLETVKGSVKIPVAMKLSPFYTSLANFAARLEAVGVDALVLFNRFYQPDIDIEELEAKRSLALSTSAALLMRIRWLAILSGRIQADLAVTGGVHTFQDAIKSVMAGAHVVQLVSSLLKWGPEYLRSIKDKMEAWMEEHEYESIEQMRGSMNLLRSPDPTAFERANYIYILQTWRV